MLQINAFYPANKLAVKLLMQIIQVDVDPV